MGKIGRNIRITRSLIEYSQEGITNMIGKTQKAKKGEIHLSISNINQLSKKVKVLLSLVFLLYVQLGTAQNYATLDTVIYPKDIPYTGESSYRFVVSTVVNEHLFLGHMKKKKFVIDEINIDKPVYPHKRYSINLKENVRTSDIIYLNVNNERKEACIITFEKITIISLDKQKVISSFPNNKFEYAFLDKDFVYLGRYYNHHPNDAKNKCVLSKFTKEGIIIDSLVIQIPFPEYTHYLPRDLFAFNGQTFVVPLFDGYRLLLIDKNLKSIDTFSVEKKDWVSPSIELSESIKKNFQNLNLYFPLLDNENFSHISRIEYVDFIDSNKIVVRWYKYDSLLKQKIRYIDEYDFNSGKLEYKGKTITESYHKIKNHLPIKEGHFPLSSSSSISYFHKKGLIQIKLDMFVEISATTTYKEYFETRKEKAKTEDPMISIWFFKYE